MHGAVAGRAVRELPRLCLRERNELVQRTSPAATQAPPARSVRAASAVMSVKSLQRVVGELRIQRRIDRHRAGVAEHQHMPVGRRARDQLGRNHAARARDVLDHERPAEDVGQLRGRACGRARRGCRPARRRRSGARSWSDSPVPARAQRDGRHNSTAMKRVTLILACRRSAAPSRWLRTPCAMVPRASSVTSGVTWNVCRIIPRCGRAPPVLVSTCRCRTSLPPGW